MNSKYETMFVVKPLDGTKIKETITKVTTFISEHHGEILDVNEWGLRKLAYEINHITEGYYVLCHFTIATETLSELETFYRLNEDIIRFIVIKQDEK